MTDAPGLRTTTLVMCKRVGCGWRIEKIYTTPAFKTGFGCLELGQKLDTKITSLSKWIKSAVYETCLTNPKMLTAIYLYQFEAPGAFCQIFWECEDEDKINKIREFWQKRARDGKSWDGYGYFLLDRGLRDLTLAEYKEYKATIIDA